MMVTKYLQKKRMTPKEIYEHMHGVLGDYTLDSFKRELSKTFATPKNINLVHDMAIKA